MTIKTFWTIALKIMGIYLLIQILPLTQYFIAFFALAFNSYHEDYSGFILAIFFLLIVLVLFFLVLRLFLFNTQWLIKFLRLESGFLEEKLDFDLKTSTALTLAIVIIGGVVFIQGLPALCMQIFSFFQEKTVWKQSPSFVNIIFYFVETLVGYLLIANCKSISRFLEKAIK